MKVNGSSIILTDHFLIIPQSSFGFSPARTFAFPSLNKICEFCIELALINSIF